MGLSLTTRKAKGVSALAQINPIKQAQITLDKHTMAAIIANPEAKNVPVVFIHGITSSIHFWQTMPVPSVMNADTRWYALSLPGHHPAAFGDDVTDDDINAAYLAGVTESALQKLLGDTPVILFGHSTGGWMSLNVAAHYPQRAHAVVSVAGFSYGQWLGMLGVNQWLARHGALGRLGFHISMGMTKRQRWLFESIGRTYGGNQAAIAAHPDMGATLDAAFHDFMQHDLNMLEKWFRRMPDVDIRDKLERITAPTLLIHGDDDRVVAPTQSQDAAERIPNAELAMFAGAGHMVMADSAEAYNALIRDWVLPRL